MTRLLPLVALLCTSLLLPAISWAQEGTVTYDVTRRIDIELPPEMEAMRDQIPTSRTVQKRLHFTPSESLFLDAPSTETEQEADFRRGGRQMRMRFAQADNQRYTNLDEGRMVDKRDFLGRTFRIEDVVPTYTWRLTGEQSTYEGYLCQKAVTERDSMTVEVWFTPQIPVPLGPGPYGGLPGLILVVNEDDGQRTYTATAVDLAPLPEDAISVPEEGRVVTYDEFDAIVEEKRKEMGASRGGTIRIRRQN